MPLRDAQICNGRLPGGKGAFTLKQRVFTERKWGKHGLAQVEGRYYFGALKQSLKLKNMATLYMLGVKKLLRMINGHLNGNNVLKISIDQAANGEQEVTIFLDKENLSKGDGHLEDPLSEGTGSERMCPVPPGCDTDGDCRARAEMHLVGNAKSYTVQSNENRLLNTSKELILLNNDVGLLTDDNTITFTIKSVDTAE